MVIKNNRGKGYIDESRLLSLLEEDSVSLKDYIALLRINSVKLIIITLVALAVSLLYALRLPDIYKSTTMLKLSKPKNDILNAPLLPELGDSKSTFVQNEIEILKSYTVREKVALAIIDSFKHKGGNYILIMESAGLTSEKPKLHSLPAIVKIFGNKVTVEQKNNLDIIEISAESPSPYEAMMISNCYADVYHEMNLIFNRIQMINVREFLEKQSGEKHSRLLEAENTLKNYQEQGGIIELSEQAKALIDQLTNFEAQKNAAKIELTMVEKNLADYKKELAKQEPKLADYLEKIAIEPYLQGLQTEIAKYEVKKDVALGNEQDIKGRSELISTYDAHIKELKEKRDNKLQVFKSGLMASSSEELKQLLQKVLDTEVKYHALSASYNELRSIVADYESRFNALPKRTIDLARLEREKGESEKLYLLIQEKYQEAMINEQSTPGNVLIIDPARLPLEPFKPNRILLVLAGLMIGLFGGVGFVIMRNYFDDTLKTPEDIQKLNIGLLGWVPKIEDINNNGESNEFIIAKRSDSIPAEAYRALRTRIQFAKIGKDSIRTILLTSSLPQEGKTLTAVNLAGSFAQAGRMTVLIDCDLRKPRISKIFKEQKSPGLTDYLYENAAYEEIIRRTGLKDLYYISSGTIPPNPSETLGSPQFLKFLDRLKNEFDMIVIDSPPVLAVTDAEILSRIADATILVTCAGETAVDTLQKSAELLQHDHGSFIGVLLNNFIYRYGYGDYYKNYYYYSQNPVIDKKSKNKKEKLLP